MTKRNRQKLFYSAVIVFVFLSIGVLFFAFGVTYDFANNQLVQTGSIAMKTNTDAQISIGEEEAGDTTLLAHNYSKRNMLPGQYAVKAQKAGFQFWQKRIEVAEGLVSEFYSIILIKERGEEEALQSEISRVFYSPDDRHLAAVQKDQIIILDLYNNSTIYSVPLARLSVNNFKLAWESHGERILAYDGLGALSIDPIAQTSVFLTSLPGRFLDGRVTWEGERLFSSRFKRGKKILESFDITTGKINLVAEDIHSFNISGRSLFFISAFDRRLYKMGLDTDSLKQFSVIENLPANNNMVSIEERDQVVYTLIGDRLYKIDQFESWLISEDVKKFMLSPNNTLLGWITGHEVWTMAIRDKLYQPQRKAGEREMLTRFSETLEDMAWHQNGAYFFLKFDTGAALLVEVDLRGGSNQYSLLGQPAGQWWQYNQILNKIVRWKDNNLALLSY